MSPRTRQIADHDIAEQAANLLVEAGPDVLTFAQLAIRCGLAPPTLVQRFGRKDALVEAAAAILRRRIAPVFADAARQPNPLRALVDALRKLAASHLAMVRLGNQIAYSLELRKQLSYALALAVEAGELPRCDVALLARTLQVTFTGAVATAALEGADTEAEITAAIENQLAIYIGDMGI